MASDTCTADSGTCATCERDRWPDDAHHTFRQLPDAPVGYCYCTEHQNAHHPYVPRPCGAALLRTLVPTAYRDGGGRFVVTGCERGHVAKEARDG